MGVKLFSEGEGGVLGVVWWGVVGCGGGVDFSDVDVVSKRVHSHLFDLFNSATFHTIDHSPSHLSAAHAPTLQHYNIVTL